MAPEPDHGTKGQVTADSQAERIFAWRRGFNAMYLIDLGVRLGLFRTLAETPELSVRKLAEKLGLHARYVETWCWTAYAFELLEAEESRFRLAPFVGDILANPSHPRYLGGYVSIGTEFIAHDYRQCLEAFRSGQVMPFQGRSDAFSQLVTESAAGLNMVAARKILPSLPGVTEQLSRGGAILEVGCGGGNLQLQLARAFPKSRCVGIDIDPTGLAAARQAVSEAGLMDRVQILEGDVSDVAPPAVFDVVVMVAVLHEIAPRLRPGVIRGCARALRPGGWLVIVDETYPSTLAESRKPEFMFAVQTSFEEMLWGNVVPTREEQEQLLHDAGFTGPITRSLLGTGFTVLTTQR